MARPHRLLAAASAALLFAIIPLSSVASPDAARPGVESPALVSTLDHPTIVDGATVPREAAAGFRVLPYLQRPAATEMTINFFTELGSDAELVVTGPGLPADGYRATIIGEANPVNEYQDSELAQGDLTRGKELVAKQGSWIRANAPVKYSHRITGLTPKSTYAYAVIVDDYRHDAQFTTLPAKGTTITEPLHLIAFSDTETDPIGRVTYREWVKSPLAEGSEERPAPGSAWDEKFGSSTRDGDHALNYAITEDRAQELNNSLIAQAKPDLILLPGDLAERGSSQTHWDEWFRYFAGDKGHVLDSIPIVTALGNHEVYGYGKPEDRSLVVRARAAYNQNFDTFGSTNPEYLDAYHRVDYGPVTIITLDATNGSADQSPGKTPPEMASRGTDKNLTPQQYGTDTQNSFTFAEYARDFPAAVAAGWFPTGTDPNTPDQPDFMPGSKQYAWAAAQLADARAAGQIILVQWHHVAYSNGVHGTPMGHESPDGQPGTPMRHLQPLLEKYDVAAVFSGHDETFQASYVDEAGDGTGVYHWDVGVASDGLRGEKMIKTADGTYEPLGFNTHSVWMAQRDEPELWRTNDAGVKHLVAGGKHYGHLDIRIAPYDGPALDSGVMPAAAMTMTPVSMFPILADDYSLKTVERREMVSGQFTVYLDAAGSPLAGKPSDEPTPEPTAEPTEEPTEGPTAAPTDEPTTPAPSGGAPTTPAPQQPGPSMPITGSNALAFVALAAALAASGLMLRATSARHRIG
ncbi:hypothetical protein BSZ39_03400 [Bowdeniella nasicola]|uniref:Calcineurin-like phosphoesterase domain-containing protein n=1 Tax=Bowdeniella nasicola TaxID=208480 RepID=A0A1Q5Q456_9ACTO|nr:metallophosphoesterase [Bowdeniella nasicola]OKL54583.1 hypothetical protein BSZ39_03400 [Bowdeniella nasicola]